MPLAMLLAVAALPADYLSNWMGALAPAINDLSILDISLPGTHDTLTYDLSTTISDGANDISPALAWVLHELGPIIGIAKVGQFIRSQAQTQWLDITAQLDNGLRFVDFRTMYTAGPDSGSLGAHDWYGLHLVQTNTKSMVYLTQIRDWLIAHPTEVIAIWFSRHGSECAKGNDQYPDVTPAVKQAFWAEIKSLFGALVFDRSGSLGRLNSTTVGRMIAAGRRVVFYATDHAEFTGNDTTVYDACGQLSNTLSGGDLDNVAGAVQGLRGEFAGAAAKRARLKAADQLYLVSMGGAPPEDVVKASAEIFYLPFERSKYEASCAAALHIPNLTSWCPVTLLDAVQLRNYYLQAALDATAAGDAAGLPSLQPPGAIYLDALDTNGSIRTGEQTATTAATWASGTTSYAYVDTLLYFNARVGCSAAARNASACTTLLAALQARRALRPLKKWVDAEHGRLASWP
mmetsp:Transcript_8059/g.21120  ORF Transcript_8059/g.21120 Transcript_8059/m.21120 type:complete len:460 (+) Transcript_8059:65-1444(+)